MNAASSRHPLQVCLLGPSEHDREEDGDALAEALSDLGLTVTRLPLGAAPDERTAAMVINTKTQVSAAFLELMPALELVITSTSGYDHIDMEAAGNRRISVIRCPLARRDAVVDTALALGLSLLRRLPLLNDAARDGRWIRAGVKQHPIKTVRDLQVGILGLGVIGTRARDVWTALGAQVRAHDPMVSESSPLDEVIENSDLVTLHCSLTATSHQLFDRARIGSMRPGAILINTARGECIDLDAALDAPHLGGLGLDVFATEPPKGLDRIAGAPQVLVSPHSAGYHAGLHRAVRNEVLAAVREWLANR